MATITRGKTFISGETVEPADMHQLVEQATITGIVNADIDANAAIAASKLALTGAITDTQLATGAVTGAAGGGKIAASAITGQTQLADPLASGDEFLVHDTSASALRRVAWSALQPAGSILQTVVSSQNLASTPTSATTADSGLSAVSITRKATNSKLVFYMSGGRWFSNGDTVKTYFYVSENGGAYSNAVSIGDGTVEMLTLNAANGYGSHVASYTYTPSSGVTTVALKIYYDVTSGGQWHAANASPFFISITEIAS